MTILGVPINIANRKAIGEGTTLAVATGQIVKPILKRVIGITAVVTRECRITKAYQQSNYERVLAHLSPRRKRA